MSRNNTPPTNPLHILRTKLRNSLKQFLKEHGYETDHNLTILLTARKRTKESTIILSLDFEDDYFSTILTTTDIFITSTNSDLNQPLRSFPIRITIAQAEDFIQNPEQFFKVFPEDVQKYFP